MQCMRRGLLEAALRKLHMRFDRLHRPRSVLGSPVNPSESFSNWWSCPGRAGAGTAAGVGTAAAFEFLGSSLQPMRARRASDGREMQFDPNLSVL